MPWRGRDNHTDRLHNDYNNLFSERRQRRSTCYAVFAVATYSAPSWYLGLTFNSYTGEHFSITFEGKGEEEAAERFDKFLKDNNLK